MTENLPDYSTVKVPDDKPPEKYSHHERRADLFRRCISAGSPYAVNQSKQADRYDCGRTTVCRDMKRLRESVSESIGDDAKLTARSVFERTLLDLRQASDDDWRASKAAFDVVMDWTEWVEQRTEIEEQNERIDELESVVEALADADGNVDMAGLDAKIDTPLD